MNDDEEEEADVDAHDGQQIVNITA